MITYFPHIPKAGGQTIYSLFYKVFGFSQCIKVWNPKLKGDITPENFSGLSDTRLKDISAVIGHLPLSGFLTNSYAKNKFDKGEVRILTSVRNPIERILSLYNYIRFYDRHPRHIEVKNTSLVDFLVGQPANYQFNFIRPSRDSKIEDVLSTIDTFQLEHSIAGFTNFFSNNFNTCFETVEIRNRTTDLAKGRQVFSVSDVPGAVLTTLEKKHQIDFELYQKSRRDLS